MSVCIFELCRRKTSIVNKKLAKTWLSCVITRRSFWMDGAKLCLLVSKPSLAALRNLSIKNRSEDKRHQKHRKNPRFCSGWTSVEGPECLEQDSMRDKIRQLLQIYKAHVYWMGKGQWNPLAPCRADPLSHDPDKTQTVPPESKVALSVKFSSPVPWWSLSQGFWVVRSPCGCRTSWLWPDPLLFDQ